MQVYKFTSVEMVEQFIEVNKELYEVLVGLKIINHNMGDEIEYIKRGGETMVTVEDSKYGCISYTKIGNVTLINFMDSNGIGWKTLELGRMI